METTGDGNQGFMRSTATLVSRGSLILTAAGLMAATFVATIDQTIVATAGATIISELGGLSFYAWVYSAFLIAATATTPIFGKLSDRVGRKRLFIFGFLIFLMGSILSGLSQSMYQLILFRGIQGLGSGAVIPIVFSLIGATFPPKLAARMQGLTFGVVGLASILGPTLGSYLVQYVNWRWIFYINLPVGFLAILAIFIGLNESKEHRTTPRMDWAGILSLMMFSVLLLFGFLDGGTIFPWFSWQEAVIFVGSLASLCGFVFSEKRAVDPVIPAKLLKNRVVSSSLAVSLLLPLLRFVPIIYAPLFVQVALVGSVADGRNVLYVEAIPFIIGSIIGGATISKGWGYRSMLFPGLVSAAIGAYLFSTFSSTSSVFQVMVAIAPIGLGAGLAVAPTLLAIQNSVRQSEIGIATSLMTFMNLLAGSIGLAVFGTIQANTFNSQLSAGHPLRDAFALSLVPGYWLALGLVIVGITISTQIEGSIPVKPSALRDPKS